MTVPSSVLAALDTPNVQYDITASERPKNLFQLPAEDHKTTVKSLLLRDSHGQVQAIFPANHFVDLDTIFRKFGRNFEGLPSSEVWALIRSKNLTCLPAIPHWEGMTTIVDEILLKKDVLLLESGDDAQMVQMDQDSFREMIKDAEVAVFTRPAPTMDSEPERDEERIITSLKRFTECRIRQRLDETLELPPLPETAQKIITLRADPNADINDLANVVELDPSLAAQVVSWAASPYYSAPGKIKSVHDAIVRVLGFDMVLNLALGLALGKTLSANILKREQIDTYWRNAVYSAAAVEGLVTSINREHRPGFGMAYLSGLLYNFGFMVMAEVFPPYFKNLTRLKSANPHLPEAIVENSLMAVSGNQIAAWLLENWNMPIEVVTALRQQTNLEYSGDYAVYPKLIYVANQMLANRGFGRNLPAEIPKSLFADINLDMEAAAATIDNILDSGEDLDAIADKMRG